MKKRGNIKGDLLKNKNGQVWIETVIYLLIAFAMMGLVLSFIKPKIEELRDKALIEQSLELIKNIDNIVTNIGSPGNKRLLEIGIKKGSLTINSSNDMVIFEMTSKYSYTESGETVQEGNIEISTEEKGKDNIITLKRDLSDEYNFTYRFEEIPKTFTKSSTSYKLFITNKGEALNKILINFDIE